MSSKKYISDEYLELNKRHHQDHSKWGYTGNKLFPATLFLDKFKPSTVLDYGCGKGRLVQIFKPHFNKFQGYDPAVDEFSKLPEGVFNAVLCFDVMEHVEEEHIEGVLEHIASLSDWVVYFYIATALSPTEILADGRNAHVSVKTEIEWLNLLNKYFMLKEFQSKGRSGFFALCRPRR